MAKPRDPALYQLRTDAGAVYRQTLATEVQRLVCQVTVRLDANANSAFEINDVPA